MIRAIVTVTWITAGVVTLLGLADRCGWLMPLWSRFFPELVLARPLTPREAQALHLANQIEASTKEVGTLRGATTNAKNKRRELLQQLRGRLGQANYSDNVDSLEMADPVVTALVWSVDSEEKRIAEIEVRIGRTQAQERQLRSRAIALENGVSPSELIELTRPSGQLSRENGEQGPTERFRRIVREALESTN